MNPDSLTQFQANNGGAGAFQFMDGSGFNASGQVVNGNPPEQVISTPAVFSSGNAMNKVQDINNTMGQYTQQISNQLQQAQQAQQAEQEKSEKPEKAEKPEQQTAQPDADPNDPNAQLQKLLLASVEETKQAQTDYYNEVQQLRAGTYPLTADQQAMIRTIEDSIKRQIQKQEQINKAYLGNLEMAGIRSGRSRYTTETQDNEMFTAQTDALQKVRDIENEGLALINQTKQAFNEKQWKMLNESFNQFQQNRTAIQNAYKDLIQVNNDAEKMANDRLKMILEEQRAQRQDALNEQKFALDFQKEERSRREAAIKFATDNLVDKPFYLVGNTAIDTATGEAVDLAEYQRRTGQKVGLSPDETDFSFIQTDIVTPEQRKLAFDMERDQFNRSLDIEKLNLERQKFEFDASGAKDVVKNQTDLRKEYNALPVVKDYNTVKQNYATIKSAAEGAKNAPNKAATDQVLIVAFNKMLDPSSVVREGEFARSTQGQSILNQLKGKADAALQGGVGLSDSDRQAIVAATERLYTDYLKNYTANALQYRGYAAELKADPDKVAPIGEQEGQMLLDDYIRQNPTYLNKVEQIEKDHPEITDLEILQILGAPGFNAVGSDTKKATPVYGPEKPSSYSSIKLGSPLAIANNNPGNLRYVGQSGATQGKGGFARFPTPEAGVKALESQIKLDASRGHTLASFINKYAPPAENDTNLYVKQISERLGVSPQTKIKDISLKELTKAIALKESSTRLS